MAFLITRKTTFKSVQRKKQKRNLQLQTGLMSMGPTSVYAIQDIWLTLLCSNLLLEVMSVDAWGITGTITKQ